MKSMIVFLFRLWKMQVLGSVPCTPAPIQSFLHKNILSFRLDFGDFFLTHVVLYKDYKWVLLMGKCVGYM